MSTLHVILIPAWTLATKTHKTNALKTRTTTGLLLMTYTEAKLLGNKDNQSFQFLEDNFSGTRAKWPT